MNKLRLGIIGTSNIAFNRFLPSLKKSNDFSYVGVATRSKDKATSFVEKWGGTIYDGYEALLKDSSIDAVYLPLPPSLHKEWAIKALEYGKHVMLEKPFTTSREDTLDIIKNAKEKKLALHENYMFVFHKQIDTIKNLLNDKRIGDLRFVRAAFGFPFRGDDDFRYHKDLGGGSLMDCGGYTLRVANEFLGENTTVKSAILTPKMGYDIDMFGTALLANEKRITAQVSFGMDNYYRCELELWGSLGMITAPRIFTSPADFSPVIFVDTQSGREEVKVSADDQFLSSINYFAQCIKDEKVAQKSCENIIRQATTVDKVKEMGL